MKRLTILLLFLATSAHAERCHVAGCADQLITSCSIMVDPPDILSVRAG